MAARGAGARRGSAGRLRLPISREVVDGGFVYRLNGRRITKRAEIERLDALVVPPAWTGVEIARSPRAKVQARGLDAAGRTQTIYHPAFRRRQDRRKFARLERFGAALPRLRAAVDRDLRRRRLSRDRVTACAVRLIDQQLFRVGSSRYAAQHRSYGVTTLRARHLNASSTSVEYDFVGKSGQRQRGRVRDARVARLVARLEELPGPEVFRFFDEDGVVRRLRSRHVNAYVKRHMGEEFTAKDFRTWGGTVIVATALLELSEEQLASEKARTAALRAGVREAAERLGNTPAVTRSSYVDPRVMDAAERPETIERARRSRARMRQRPFLDDDEQGALALLAAVDGSRATSR
ncbi:DNA topoisomerase IB [Leucobacter muris]|uniref:DNA topoisomerase n=1 Tax=Leucobacter muris TaxID=1935379 RepID=A0ABX5QGD8_9MICO|nr:DNA topoisomerase IB [Leucobacter muris]